MKIGLVIYGTLDTLSGGFLYDRHLVAYLRAQGCQVETISLPWRDYPSHLLDNADLAWARALASMDYDLLIQDELNHPSLFLLNFLIRVYCTYPIVSIVHHLRSSEEHPPATMRLYRIVEKIYLNSVDGFIFNSHTTRQSVQRHIGADYPNIVAYPAADHRDPLDRQTVLSAIQSRMIANDPLQLIFVGNLIPRKGLHLLLDALGRLTTLNWKLHIVGSHEVDSDYSAAMLHRANTLSIQSNVTWHGRLPDDALTKLLATCDLMVMPSYEGFGIVYLEAMAFGLPVIASTAGAAHEIIEPGKNGYLIDPDDELALATHLDLLINNRPQIANLAYFARQTYDDSPTWDTSMASVFRWLCELA